MLSQPSIETIFQQFVTVRLYEDRVPEGTKQVPGAEEAQDFAGENWATTLVLITSCWR